MTIAIKIETDLVQILTEINQKLNNLQNDVTDIKVRQVRWEAELKGDIKNLDDKLSGQIKNLDEKLTGEIKTIEIRLTGEVKTLEAKVDGIGKRLDNQEFTSRGILIGLIVAIIGGFAKLFGVIGNP